MKHILEFCEAFRNDFKNRVIEHGAEYIHNPSIIGELHISLLAYRTRMISNAFMLMQGMHIKRSIEKYGIDNFKDFLKFVNTYCITEQRIIDNKTVTDTYFPFPYKFKLVHVVENSEPLRIEISSEQTIQTSQVCSLFSSISLDYRLGKIEV